MLIIIISSYIFPKLMRHQIVIGWNLKGGNLREMKFSRNLISRIWTLFAEFISAKDLKIGLPYFQVHRDSYLYNSYHGERSILITNFSTNTKGHAIDCKGQNFLFSTNDIYFHEIFSNIVDYCLQIHLSSFHSSKTENISIIYSV